MPRLRCVVYMLGASPCPCACRADQVQSEACFTASVSVRNATQPASGQDISTAQDTLNAALASGSAAAVVTAVRQFAAVTADAASSSGSAADQAVWAQQVASAMAAMQSILAGGDVSVDDALGMAGAAQSLVDATPSLSADLADNALKVSGWLAASQVVAHGCRRATDHGCCRPLHCPADCGCGTAGADQPAWRRESSRLEHYAENCWGGG